MKLKQVCLGYIINSRGKFWTHWNKRRLSPIKTYWVFTLKQPKHMLESLPRFLIYKDVERCKCFIGHLYKILEIYDNEKNSTWTSRDRSYAWYATFSSMLASSCFKFAVSCWWRSVRSFSWSSNLSYLIKKKGLNLVPSIQIMLNHENDYIF